ncbi:pyridoxamine 5'-phosphate oxidase family protein [Amaricoccus solimangrovi]|uniref:General stress protein n=1 Tax=Amaricoccus solimangrovi TaxID=2589815 RepID=A0A501WSY1_9RHOB|nr:pyridoxamine 5'-phosphate oxidase family protein [Amaricoccus solimangrovi]TPE52529.1 general stress protein [Amaricoccus solimangrovi]
MSDLKAAREHPEDLLWDNLKAAHAGMLGVEGGPRHMQPMAHFPDPDNRRLWFLTRRDTELYERLRSGAAAHFVLVSKSQDFHACLDGEISERFDRERLDEIWGPAVSAWFEGKDDPQLKMLALDLKSAGIWASTGSSLAFFWETAKANMQENTTPDVGVHRELAFT